MFSDQLRAYAHRIYTAAQPTFGNLKTTIAQRMAQLSEERRVLMELAYGSLPISDVGSVPWETLLSYVDHAIFLRETWPHAAALPEDIFLHDVFYPRVGTEAIVDCRTFFYGATKDILTLPEEDRILAVNRWCAAQVTYQAADDRTENPITAYRSGYGRCGEESVFAVSVLRSLGIPARQVYAPWWSHCDDNHAWVEVWQKGQWVFLGACEIEPVLNRGWFISAATRAPLVHSKTYFDYDSGNLSKEEYIGQDGPCRMLNQTYRYAQTGKARLQVVDVTGAPQQAAEVQIQVINMAAVRTIARLKTDEAGMTSVTLGCGSFLAEAKAGLGWGKTAFQVTGDETAEIVLVCGKEQPEDQETELDFCAPASSGKNSCPLTPEQQRQKLEEIAQAEDKRMARITSGRVPLPEGYPETMRELLDLAGANGTTITQFYDQRPENQKPLALEFLRTLAKKDLKDVTGEVLCAHVEAASSLPVSSGASYVPYVLCPRIGWEELEDWRDMLREAFTPAQRESFMNSPPALLTYIQEQYLRSSNRYHRELTMTPNTVLTLGYGDRKACRHLFVAILRTLGIPSRLSPRDGSAQYECGGRFLPATELEEPQSVLTLCKEPGVHWVCETNFTLVRREDEADVLIRVGEEELGEPIALPAGRYRLITTNRLPNGNQLVRMREFALRPGQHKTLELSLRRACPEQMLADNPLPGFILEDECGHPIKGQGNHLLIWLDVGTEPTEHILNELLDSREKLNAMGLPVFLLVQDRSNLQHPTLAKVLQKLPHSTIAWGDFAVTQEGVARAMYLEPGLWPLLILADGQGHGRYGHCGYGVGIVELALKLAAYIPE